MNKEFIPYEQALELKELGFDERCFAFWDGVDKKLEDTSCRNSTAVWLFKNSCSAPLFQQAFHFFREKYKLHFPIAVSDGYWFFERWRLGVYKTYEEAELACLKKLIEIIKLSK